MGEANRRAAHREQRRALVQQMTAQVREALGHDRVHRVSAEIAKLCAGLHPLEYGAMLALLTCLVTHGAIRRGADRAWVDLLLQASANVGTGWAEREIAQAGKIEVISG